MMGKRDKTTCTLTYRGKTADLEDRAATEALVTGAIKDALKGEPMKARAQYLFPELEPTAIQLAYLVGQLEAVEVEKKAVNEDFKERIDLLKIQIKQAAKAINDSMESGRVSIRPVPEQPGAAEAH